MGGSFWVLIIEDDQDSAAFARAALERGADMLSVHALDGEAALRALQESRFDLIICDVELPGRSGIDLLPDIHRLAPGVPVIVLTAHVVVKYAVAALRGNADEFLAKPVDAKLLTTRATALAAEGRKRRSALERRRNVLAVGAHPDDVEIGIGATLAGHQAVGDKIAILTMSGGSFGGPSSERHAEAEEAAALVGAKLIHLDFPDTQIEPANGVIRAIEEVISGFVPNQVYTHSGSDRHQDHRAVNAAVQIAARSVPNLACYQSPSTTIGFRPSHFVDVEQYLDTKVQMLACFKSQSHRNYMQEDLVRGTARYWSRFGVGRFAEPLEIIRSTATLDATSGPKGELEGAAKP